MDTTEVITGASASENYAAGVVDTSSKLRRIYKSMRNAIPERTVDCSSTTASLKCQSRIAALSLSKTVNALGKPPLSYSGLWSVDALLARMSELAAQGESGSTVQAAMEQVGEVVRREVTGVSERSPSRNREMFVSAALTLIS